MLRVCGITFDHTINYGSCLQAYALQTTIENCVAGEERCSYDLIPFMTLIKKEYSSNLVLRVKQKIRSLFVNVRHRKFEKFENRYMHYADCRTGDDLSDLNKKYDAFVCGSDVIWNPQFNRRDSAYFLDFAEKYKFSYAASFGRFAPDEQTEQQLREYLPRLDGISVRESSAVEIVRKYTDKTVHHVVDPVLLLKKEQWEKLADHSCVPRKPYIFVYTTHMNAVTRDAMNRIQKELALPLVHVTWKPKDAIKERAFQFPSQLQWLGLLMNAEYVITNSFHGTAFSVLLEKNFASIVDGDVTKGNNTRMYSFLEKIGLEKRIFSKVGNDLELSQPDFTYADQVLTQWRADSMQYIKDNLDAAEARRISG